MLENERLSGSID